ncbi:hypothetical protein [Pseudomonas veronii]|uniref:Uncharacterized protein n=1 Tax=Pseudomonas veronii TaxID=76761 RepID=A0A5M8F6A3_PSEVE|nr:hypothetical protein [Pseudomonas veronii]KAA6176931.1 hypothetical protein F3K54_12805 [Pseudomonas veronii]KAA6179250.1 hypothetical protein F3K53_14195 [Pseudomonas veronii]
MTNPVPGLNIRITGPFDQAEVNLSTFTGPLVVSIPNDAELFPGGKVYVILGPNSDAPAWEGAQIDAGEWQKDTEQYQRRSNLKLEVPKQDLLRFKNQTTLLRYIAQSESNMQIISEPISLTVTT